MAQRMGFESYKEYLEHQAKQRGFNSMRDYREYMDEQKQKRAETQVLSSLIKERLTELGENQSWLAKKLNVSRQMVSLYIQGKRMPSKKRLHDLFLILDVPYQSLDDLLQ